MPAVHLKLKQASVALAVTPKELQNLVQFGVVRPRKRAGIYWFDWNRLLQAKIALYVKASLCPSLDYLAQFIKAVSKVKLDKKDWDDLCLVSAPAKGRPAIEIKVPLRELKKELEVGVSLAASARDLPRGRRRSGWKREFLSTLRQAGDDIGVISEADIQRAISKYRSEQRKRPDVILVTKVKQTA
jgi:hypothetical protein